MRLMLEVWRQVMKQWYALYDLLRSFLLISSRINHIRTKLELTYKHKWTTFLTATKQFYQRPYPSLCPSGCRVLFTTSLSLYHHKFCSYCHWKIVSTYNKGHVIRISLRFAMEVYYIFFSVIMASWIRPIHSSYQFTGYQVPIWHGVRLQTTGRRDPNDINHSFDQFTVSDFVVIECESWYHPLIFTFYLLICRGVLTLHINLRLRSITGCWWLWPRKLKHLYVYIMTANDMGTQNIRSLASLIFTLFS